MFIDKTRLYIQSGSGGNGCMSFRREKYVPRGGPNGGNGGKGGNVYLKTNTNIRTLRDFYYRPHYFAEKGKNGGSSNKTGENGKDLVLDIPCGTVVKHDNIVIADIVNPEEKILVATGGIGGRGNAAFKTNANRAPRISEKGAPGEKITLDLELRLIADVSIIGCPNAGKSTFISAVTSARPKIAEYPFTTLEPILGTCDIKDKTLVFIDVPGLIENAHSGKGLGDEFLRHIRRTRVILHIIDIWGFNNRSASENYCIINEELKKYDSSMIDKPMVVAINKTDIPGSEQLVKDFKKNIKLSKQSMLFISALKKNGIKDLLLSIRKNYDKAIAEENIAEHQPNEAYYKIEPRFNIEKQGNVFVVTGKQVERLIAMTNFDQPESMERIQNIFIKIGLERVLKKNGINPGDVVKIGEFEFEYEPANKV